MVEWVHAIANSCQAHARSARPSAPVVLLIGGLLVGELLVGELFGNRALAQSVEQTTPPAQPQGDAQDSPEAAAITPAPPADAANATPKPRPRSHDMPLLIPPECLLLYNSKLASSQKLARQYAGVRNIPLDHLLGLSLPNKETISRGDYEKLVAAPVREFLAATIWGSSIRCLVTFYGVPLRVEPDSPSESERQIAQALESRQSEIFAKMDALVYEIVSDIQPSREVRRTPLPEKPEPVDIERVRHEFRLGMDMLQVRALKMQGDQANDEWRRLVAWIERAQGLRAVVNLLKSSQQAGEHFSTEEIENMSAVVDRSLKAMQALDRSSPRTAASDDVAVRTQELFGLMGLLEWNQEAIRRLLKLDTGAAVDSELMLLHWDDYDLDRQIPNPLQYAYIDDPEHPWTAPANPVLMVSRLDGPRPPIVRRMIDVSAAVEAAGLHGTIYVDSKGESQVREKMMRDMNLYHLASLARGYSDLPVVYDNQPQVFAKGRCPDAALYCGWFNPGEYVDAFTFVDGAVAVHLGVAELASLRDRNHDYWCKEFIAKGAVATLGAVEEPYLDAIPWPAHFFGTLMTGKFTLAQCYAYTLPHCSWKVALVGDPLYRPFAKNPQVPVKNLPTAPR